MTAADPVDTGRRSLTEGESLKPAASPSKPYACTECVRLDQRDEAAFLAGDRSRLADIRVLRRRHAAEGHTIAQ